MSPILKSLLATVAAFCVAPFAYLQLAVTLDSAVVALGAYIRSDASIPESERYAGAFGLLFVVFPLLAVLGALSALVFTCPPAILARWKKIIAVSALIIALILSAIVPTMVSSDWSARAVPASETAHYLAYGITVFSFSLPALWALVLAWRCRKA